MEILLLIAIGAILVYFTTRKQTYEIVIRTEVSTTTDRYERDDDVEPAPDKDNWERFDFYGASLVPAKGRYHITYTDQSGLDTERDIDIKRVYSSGGEYAMAAFCHLRGAHRTFIDNRVKSATDLDTGEIVASVANHAIAQFKDTGEGRAIAAIDREWMAAAILSFVCRADGRMLKAERAVVADYFKRRCPDITQDEAELDKAIKTIGEPDQREFKRIISDMKAAGDIERLRDILDCARRIVATQKTIDPMEAAALEILAGAVG